MGELQHASPLVITEEYEAEETWNRNKIRFVPLWKWLLDPAAISAN